MKESLRNKIQAIKAGGKGKKQVLTLKHGQRDSLSEVIKTKEQADLFMKMLKSAQ